MIRVRNLEKTFAGAKGEVRALCGVSFEVRKGELFTLLGPSGCGKTTTLRCIAGLEQPVQGEISIDDRIMYSAENRIFVAPEKRRIGMVFQSYAIWPHMTVFENVAYPMTIQRKPKDQIRKRVLEVLRIVGLTGLEDRPAPKLSGGQQQRVAFARALVNEPKVMLLDEPLSNLDAKLREQMRFEIKALQRRVNITTIYVTHDQGEALAISDQIAVMHAGKLIEVGDPHQLYSRPKRKFTATFLGLTNLINGKVVEIGGDSQPGRVETKRGILSFVPTSRLEKNQTVVISIRPEHIQVYKTKPQEADNVVEGIVKEAVFMGDAYHCQIAVGDDLVRVHTHPFLSVNLGDKVYLRLDPQSCNGLPAEDVEGMDESMMGM